MSFEFKDIWWDENKPINKIGFVTALTQEVETSDKNHGRNQLHTK